MGSWGCTAFPAPTQVIILLETKQQQQWKKIIYIYISPQPPWKTQMDGISPQQHQQEIKAKVPPRVRPECMSQLGPNSPGAHPDLPAPLALAHLWRPLARGAPAAGGKAAGPGLSHQLAAASRGEGRWRGKCVTPPPPPRCLSGRSRVSSPHRGWEAPCSALSCPHGPTPGSQPGSGRAPWRAQPRCAPAWPGWLHRNGCAAGVASCWPSHCSGSPPEATAPCWPSPPVS